MPPSTYKIGSGHFQIGTTPDDLNMSVQLRSLAIVPAEDVQAEDDIEVLSGPDDTVVGEDRVRHTFTVTGTVLQDTLAQNGMIDFTWFHAGETLYFTFTPRMNVTRTVSGLVRVAPLQIGGDVGARPEASFSWVGVGPLPTLEGFI